MKKAEIKKSSVRFRTFTGEIVPAVGELLVDVSYRGETKQLPLYVVKGKLPNLIGRNWLYEIQLDWKRLFGSVGKVNKLNDQPLQLESLLAEYSDLFKDELGTLKDSRAHIHLKEGAEPKFVKARPVPYALTAKVEKEIDRLVEAGIFEPVDVSDWATPVVPVIKPDKTVRLCGDYIK